MPIQHSENRILQRMGRRTSREDLVAVIKKLRKEIPDITIHTGVMASILNIFALYKANILTIHQSIPINGKGLLTVSVDIEDSETDVSAMIQDVEKIEDVSYVKIIAME